MARQQVTRNADFLTLAKARYQVGQATLLDVRQAEVTKGQSDVALLRAVQAENEAKLDLLRRMGVEPPVAGGPDRAHRLVSRSRRPTYQLDSLLALADEQNPALRSLRARRTAASLRRPRRQERVPADALGAGRLERVHPAVHQRELPASTSRWPTRRSQAASCQSNNQVRAAVGPAAPATASPPRGSTPAAARCRTRSASRSATRNNVFPFNYTGQPFQASLRISLPIFTGFGRSLRLSQARAAGAGRRRETRARAGSRCGATCTPATSACRPPIRRSRVQAANREAARDQLRLAQDRYRLGAGTSLEVSDAQNAVQRAEGDYVNAVYDYHKAIAALEAAVGRPLR